MFQLPEDKQKDHKAEKDVELVDSSWIFPHTCVFFRPPSLVVTFPVCSWIQVGIVSELVEHQPDQEPGEDQVLPQLSPNLESLLFPLPPKERVHHRVPALLH